MLIDSHCHLASHRFSRDEIPDLLARASANGVSQMVTLATSLDDVADNLELASHPHIHACVGIHPCDVHHAPDDAVEILSRHAADSRVAAIGETGLDYFHPAPESWEEAAYRKRQRDFLEQHFALAAASGLSVVVHTRDREGSASFEDALAIYRNHHSKVRAVFHCFIAAWENGARVLELGGLLSFGGVSTFKNAPLARDSATRCPAGRFMLETDAPYLAPQPHRGKRNEPSFIRHTAECLAELRGESLEDLAEHTCLTAEKFFRFRRN